MTDTTESELSEAELAVLGAIPWGGTAARDIRVPGVSAQKRRHVLATLARRGIVEIVPNPWGPETPEWWGRVEIAPSSFVPTLEVEKGMLFDYLDLNGRPLIWIELTGKVNEFGCVEAYLKAGEHNARVVYVQRYHLESGLAWRRRYVGEVTAWSSKFACPVHGECTENMVTTKKTCSLCDTGLLRF